MKNKIIIIILAIAVLGFASYYFINKDKTDVKPTNEITKIKVGYIPIADCAQLYIAKDKGYFKENGLDVELIKLAGGAKILEALAGGSIDVAFSNVVSVMLANNAGLDFKAITGGPAVDLNHKETGVLVLKDSDIKSLKDLEGKKIAVNTRKNIVELFVTNYLIKNNVDVSKIEFVEISFPQMFQVLDSKNVDAIASIEPFVTFSTKSGKVTNLGDYFVSVLDKMEISTYNASNKYITSNKEVITNFQKAINQATLFSKSNTDELKTIIANNTKLNEEQVKDIVLPLYNNKVDVESFNEILKMVKEKKWVNEDLNSSNIIYK
jgi:NitT/TauT family transport system substrate-binding protein